MNDRPKASAPARETAGSHPTLQAWLKSEDATVVVNEANRLSGMVIDELERRQQLDPSELQKPFTV